MPAVPDKPGASRRTFLTGAGAAALAGLTAAACSDDDGPERAGPEPGPDAASPSPPPAIAAASAPTMVPFSGPHQQGLVLPAQPAGIVASFDATATSRADLAAAMQDLSDEIERVMAGGRAEQLDEFLPPPDSGALGPSGSAVGTSVSVAVGASLFDDRFGLAETRPRELIAMPAFFNDRLVEPARSHGDVSLIITAPTQQAAVYALHQAVRATDRRLQLRWVQEGYNDLLPPSAESIAPARNLMGFRDGTSNLDTTDSAVMDEFVWVQRGDDEPDWATGGTYIAARLIRMLIEFWATAALIRQEQIFGRHRATGAPLGQSAEGDLPAFADDPADQTVPVRSHIRRANPHTAGVGRILRRGFSYLNGADDEGTLDQGLLFLAFQRSMSRGFLEVQARLDGEALEDYIKPVGGGFFFVLPGPGDGFIGESLLS